MYLQLLKVGRGWAGRIFHKCVLGASCRGCTGLNYLCRNLAAAANSSFLIAERTSLCKNKTSTSHMNV